MNAKNVWPRGVSTKQLRQDLEDLENQQYDIQCEMVEIVRELERRGLKARL